ncbi:MAG: tetratricopeptide repeat-containing sensor histidine kinase [Winogradskyella sp.]|uniref:ATP-binding protein n=1 Tax=Winogradskyella sp. TaxID=1883156 RepID=UPI000F3B1DF6|nr:tetratricopeptide repeat-containing sensor histidine kinase [Winogradskyella sp.]RNC87732.1 MAG: tetratricopeptide repeat-containing sensor histidine kinase [Winogradskyella sp.]
MLKKYFILLALALFPLLINSQISKELIDSLDYFRNSSKNQNYTLNEQIAFAEKASSIASRLKLDSLLLKNNRELSLLYYSAEMNEKYESINRFNLELSTRLSDTSGIAAASFNLGGVFEFNYLKTDSAYFYYSKALKAYDFIDDTYGRINTLMAIADIQDTEKDYIGSEENAVLAIELINLLPVNEQNLENLWSLNNLLGVTSQNLRRNEKSLEYHEKAYKIASKMKNGDYNKTITINNQAGVYRKLKNYEKALELYNSLIPLRNIYEGYDPTFYPLIIDNIAYTKVAAGHSDNDVISKMFYEAYNLSEKLDDDVTKLAVTIDLSKFYKKLELKDSTLKYAEKAYNLSKRISSNDILLESMVLLSGLKEGEEGKAYLIEHIKLTDSLLQVERNVSNKFARIELETDQIEAKNEQISKENFYLLLLSAGLLLTGILVYVLISQRAKNKELKYIQDQQEVNEQIYNLMLNQQDKVEEARSQEKIRVSKELHDGVLGRLFGARLSLDSLNFSEGKEAMMNRANYIGQLKTIEDDIRKISHEMNTDFVAGSGFKEIVSELVDNQARAYGYTYDFDFTDDISWDFVPNKSKINIYRIIQESMQNIYKHAEAQHVKIKVLRENDDIILYIVDNGKGFDTTKAKKGIGLKNMTSRVSDINGKIQFFSELSRGTTVEVKIPYSV